MRRGRDDEEQDSNNNTVVIAAAVAASMGGSPSSSVQHAVPAGTIMAPTSHPAASAAAAPSSSAAVTSATSSSSVNPFTGKPYSSHYFSLQKTRQMLPMWDKRDTIKKHVAMHQVTLLVGETGSGKTTQVPQFVLEMKPVGMIACTQPRRVAAMSVAMRVAEEMDIRVSETVGYNVRFQRLMSENTKIVYLTDGMLLREAQTDPNLSKYSVIIIDEAHERAVDTDILIGFVKLLSKRRQDLRVVIMSATLDMEKFSTFFDKAPLLKVPGRMFNVQVFYTQEPVRDYVEAAIDHVIHIHATEPSGDILVFLIGEAEIERAVSRTQDRILRLEEEGNHEGMMRAKVLPLYGSLSIDNQKRVFLPAEPNTRKIIYATNIAETSVTIDGVVYVVDSGYHKQTLYDAKVRIDSLLPSVVSKASAEQRRGRAGRTRPGKCYRLFCEKDFATLPDQAYPEVLRSSMISTVLTLLRLGIDNPCSYPFIDPPSHQSFLDAFMQLTYYGAMDPEEGTLTELGKSMADLPLAPHVARMLLKSAQHGCSVDMCIIAAMLEVGHVFIRPQRRQGEADQQRMKFMHPDCDFLTLFNAFHMYYGSNRSASVCETFFVKYTAMAQAIKVYDQLLTHLQRRELPIASLYQGETKTIDAKRIRRALLEGYFTQVAYLSPGAEKYRTVKDRQVAALHPQSALARRKPTWVMYDSLELQSKDGCFIRLGATVEPEWLAEVSPEYFDLAEIEDGEIAAELKAVMQRSGGGGI